MHRRKETEPAANNEVAVVDRRRHLLTRAAAGAGLFAALGLSACGVGTVSAPAWKSSARLAQEVAMCEQQGRRLPLPAMENYVGTCLAQLGDQVSFADGRTFSPVPDMPAAAAPPAGHVTAGTPPPPVASPSPGRVEPPAPPEKQPSMAEIMENIGRSYGRVMKTVTDPNGEIMKSYSGMIRGIQDGVSQ